MSLNVLQFGTTGQVGIELARQAAGRDLALRAVCRAEADFTQADAAARLVREARPQLVIIAAAHTAVDQAESEPELARRINAEAPAEIARACAEVGAALVNFSTDYVFDGEARRPYAETDTTDPLNVYGRSKLEGESAVLAACPRSLVLRTSWVVSSHGKNFVKTMLRLAREGQPIRVVDDQFGRPTAAADLAGFVLQQAQRLAAAPAGDAAFGVFHYANAGETNWREFAQAVFELAFGEAAPPVQAIRTAERPTPARRPARGVLDTAKLEGVFGVRPRPWREALADIVKELSVAEAATAA